MERKVGKQYKMKDGCVLRIVDKTFRFINKSGKTTELKLTDSCQKIIIRLLRSLGEKVVYEELYALYGEVDPVYQIKPASVLQKMKGTMDPIIRPYIKTFCVKNTDKVTNKVTTERGYHIPDCTAIEDIQLTPLADSIPLVSAGVPSVDSSQQLLSQETVAYKKSRWRYKVMILDDVPDYLHLLKNSLEAVFENENRYEIDISTCDCLLSTIIQSRSSNIDLYILDVARKSVAGSQIGDDWYFGGSFLKTLVSESPEMLLDTRIIFYTKLPRIIVYNELGSSIDIAQKSFGASIDYYSKQKDSPHCVAMSVKEYFDALYAKENSDLKVE